MYNYKRLDSKFVPPQPNLTMTKQERINPKKQGDPSSSASGPTSAQNEGALNLEAGLLNNRKPLVQDLELEEMKIIK